MASKRKIKKAIKSFDKRIEEHHNKINSYDGRDDTLIEYWEKEIKGYEKQKQNKKEKLEKN
jgi:hypothetical protein